MLTENEKAFLVYWEENRLRESGFASKILRGLPMAVVFALPIILSVVVIRLFFPDWSTKVSQVSQGMIWLILIATLLVILFYSYFRMHYKWEQNEQLYRELKARQRNQTNK